MKTTIIIGGGAAGLMAAAALAQTAPETAVVLIEKNEAIGKKVLLTGGGRCNVTTGLRDVREVLKRYPHGGPFLNSAMHRFPPEAVYRWFEDQGVPLKTEEDRRVFPRSDRSQDVVDAFSNLFQESANIRLLLDATVVRAERVGRQFLVHLKNQSQPLPADRLIVTTGGQAHPATGSTGDGYSLARSFGHAVTPLAPSLSSFRVSQHWPSQVSGLSFPEARLTAVGTGKSFTGPFVFTHQGLSGPAVFALSALTAREEIAEKRPLEIAVDLFPEETVEELTARLAAAVESNPARQLDKVLVGLIPKSLAEVAVQVLTLPWSVRMDQVGKRDIRAIAEWLKGIRLKATQRGGGTEFVTSGGVELSEVNPSTMESKLVPGLYFAGEVLDIDGVTGGFNLQAAWCTGRLAGESAGV